MRPIKGGSSQRATFRRPGIILGRLLVFTAFWPFLVAALLIKREVFPFISFETMGAASFDSYKPAFHHIPLDAQFVSAVRSANPEAVSAADKGDTMEAARLLAAFTRSKFRNGSDVVLSSPQQALDAPAPVPALCSEYAKFFVACCEALEIPARVVWMDKHTTSEIWIDGKPAIADANGNLIARGSDGLPCGIADLRDDAKFEELVPASGGDDPSFVGKSNANVYRAPQLVAEIEGAHLFDFHRRNYSPTAVVGTLFGSPIARGHLLRPPSTVYVGRGPFMLLCAIIAAVNQFLVGLGLWFVVFRKPSAQ